MKIKILIWPLVLSFLLAGCSLFEDDKDALPSETQEGKGTFGCKLNGAVWIPSGKQYDRKLYLSYDPAFQGGTFVLSATKYANQGPDESISLVSNNLSHTGTYLSDGPSEWYLLYYDPVNSCGYEDVSKTDVHRQGILNITTLDLPNHIISGTFEFTISSGNCDTVKITEGRFDMKF